MILSADNSSSVTTEKGMQKEICKDQTKISSLLWEIMQHICMLIGMIQGERTKSQVMFLNRNEKLGIQCIVQHWPFSSSPLSKGHEGKVRGCQSSLSGTQYPAHGSSAPRFYPSVRTSRAACSHTAHKPSLLSWVCHFQRNLPFYNLVVVSRSERKINRRQSH